jgi:hypothetical protein
MHKWSPDSRDTFDNFTRTKAFKMGADLTRNNYPHDWNEVLSNVFVARTTSDILLVYNDIRNLLLENRQVALESQLIINGRNYVLYGRDEGSAKLLYSILAMAVSSEQIANLRDDILGSGLLSRILLDDSFQAKIAQNHNIPLFGKILRFFDFFKIYVADDVLSYAASILLFENEFTERDISIFSTLIPTVKNLMITELEMESITLLKDRKHPNLELIYHPDHSFTDPWRVLDEYETRIKPLLDAPFLEGVYDYADGFKGRVNAGLDAMRDFWRDCLKPATEIFGANLLAATHEFNQDIVLNVIRSHTDDYQKQFAESCRVYLYGSNRLTRFAELGLHDNAMLHVLSFDKTIPYDLRLGNHMVVHKTPESYITSLSDSADRSILIYDFVDTENITTDRAVYRLDTTNAPESSMSRCFDSFGSFFRKVGTQDPLDYHMSLPYMVVFRFIPFHDSSDRYTASILRRLVHHFSLRYYLPLDFGGLGFTILATKRVKMLPKIHTNLTDPLNMLDAFVYHSLCVRLGFLDNVRAHRISWRIFGAFRMLSRYHGYGAGDKKFKVQDVLKFAEWGETTTITDFNNIFGECDAPEIFTRRTTILRNTKKSKNNQKRYGIDIGQSILNVKSDAVKNYFDTMLNPALVGAKPAQPLMNTRSPLFKRERAVAASEAFPLPS